MGCCPSTARAARGNASAAGDVVAEKTAAGEGIHAPAPASVASAACAAVEQVAVAFAPPSPSSVARTEQREADVAVEKPVAAAEEREEEELRPAEDVAAARAQFKLDEASLPLPSLPRGSAAPSPARTPINFDELPISSTYHRVQCATVADREARRLAEELREAEQHEREVREFRQAMQASPDRP